VLGNAGQTKLAAKTNSFRTQLDNAIKKNPDMEIADNYFSAFKAMEKAAAAGEAAWTKSLPDLVSYYNRMGIEQKRMFRTAMIQTVETKGFTSTQLTEPRISGQIAEVPAKIRMLYPEGPAGDAMYQRVMDELGMSARMHKTFTEVGKISPASLTTREPQGLMKTLSLLAKIPAYKFSMEFALGRDLINRARKVDASVSTGIARELNEILALKSGPEASAMIDDLASTAVRMRGNIPAANSLKAFADTLRSIGAYTQAGQEVNKIPPIEGTMTGTPQGDVDIPAGLFRDVLEEDEAYQRTYPATEMGASLIEDYGVPVADYLKRKVPYWWRGPQ